MRDHALTWISIGFLAACCAPAVAAAEYFLTTIATSDQPTLGGFAGTIAFFQAATLNESGQVVFMASMQQLAIPPPCVTFNNVVVVGDENSMTALNDPSSTFHPFGFPVGINEAGQTSFLGQHLTEISPGSCEIGPSGIYRGDTGTITKIADESIFDGIAYGAYSQVDEAGTVTFISRGAVRNGVYQGTGTESVFGDYVVVEENPSGVGPPDYDEMVAVNALGQVAYLVNEADGSQRISRLGPSGVVTIARTGDVIDGLPGPILGLGPPAINDSGKVAFTAGAIGFGEGIFIGDAISTQMVYLFPSPGTLLSRHVSINNDDAVLIGGSFDGEKALYVIRNQNLEQVAGTGDPLLGSTIDDILAVSPALNDAGQVSFLAGVAGGPNVIVRADPVAAPVVPSLSQTFVGVLAAFLAILGARRVAHIRIT